MAVAATKQCIWCRTNVAIVDFPPTGSQFFKDTTVDICYQCQNKRQKLTDLHQVDKVLQWIDAPFLPDAWIRLWELNGENTLRIYLQQNGFNKYNRNVDWGPTNDTWQQHQLNGTLKTHQEIHNQETARLQEERWGKGYTFEEYTKMEGFYIDLSKTQSFVTATQQDQAKILCKISLTIHEKLAKGEDISKELKSYNDTIKSAGFEPKNSRNYGDFESTGEVMNYQVRKGYMPKFYDGVNRDEVDFTIANQQTYLRRLVYNEPGIADIVSSRKEAYRISQQQEEEGQDDASLDKYENAGFDVQMEGEDEFDDSIQD